MSFDPVEILRYTLVADGPSDACLLHMINWVLKQHLATVNIKLLDRFADLRDLPERVGSRLRDRLPAAVDLLPCDMLFVHRDAERQSPKERRAEVEKVVRSADLPIHVPIIPVRMTEAWLLVDEAAIRMAADNPNGTAQLPIPALQQLENVPDPKKILSECLLEASELRGRRRNQLKATLPRRRARVAGLIRDCSVLRELSAFREFETETRLALEKWKPIPGGNPAR